MMFGKKKDEEWEYIEQYFQKDNYGQVADEEYWEREHKSTAYLMELFRPYLKRDEQVLCVIGGGKGKTNDIFESGKNQRKIKGVKIAGAAFFIVSLAVFFISFFIDSISGLFMLLFILLFTVGIPCAMIGGITALIIWAVTVGNKGFNYAITDRRIISHGYGEMKVISFDHIKSTSANAKSITLRLSMYEGVKTNMIYVLPNVGDPLRVKYILDQAIEKYKAGGVRND